MQVSSDNLAQLIGKVNRTVIDNQVEHFCGKVVEMVKNEGSSTLNVEKLMALWQISSQECEGIDVIDEGKISPEVEEKKIFSVEPELASTGELGKRTYAATLQKTEEQTCPSVPSQCSHIFFWGVRRHTRCPKSVSPFSQTHQYCHDHYYLCEYGVN